MAFYFAVLSYFSLFFLLFPVRLSWFWMFRYFCFRYYIKWQNSIWNLCVRGARRRVRGVLVCVWHLINEKMRERAKHKIKWMIWLKVRDENWKRKERASMSEEDVLCACEHTQYTVQWGGEHRRSVWDFIASVLIFCCYFIAASVLVKLINMLSNVVVVAFWLCC